MDAPRVPMCDREHPTSNLHHNTNTQDIGKTINKALKNRNNSQHLERKKIKDST
jgi:hypothetical protein